MNIRLCVICLASQITVLSSYSGSPALINYQGRLADGTHLVSGPVSLVLRVYTNAVTGSVLFEDSNTVNVVDGLYAVRLGAHPVSGTLTSALAGGRAWIETVVNGTVLSPREQMVSSPYALDGDFVRRTGDTMTGTLTIDSSGHDLIIDSPGTDVLIGHSANGQFSGTAIGSGANAYDYGAAIGFAADGSSYGAGVGLMANGASYGSALGYQAVGHDHGAAAGYQARATNYGSAVGYQANGVFAGAAVGADANAWYGGAALGCESEGATLGVAAGYGASGSGSNVAIGAFSHAAGAMRTAIGYSVTNATDNSITVRGSLYLDGGMDIYYRPAFGTGSWINILSSTLKSDTNYVKKTGDSLSGSLNISAAADADLAIGSAGTNVMVGKSANGYHSGTAIGFEANGSWYGAAVGLQAKGGISGVGLGATANGQNFGAAIGNSANASDNGVAMGVFANGAGSGVAVGRSAAAGGTNVAVGFQANTGNGSDRVAIGHNVTNDIDQTVRLRGSLYLDGGTGVYVRTSFGAGGWNSLLEGYATTGQVASAYVSKAGDTMTGALGINSGSDHTLRISSGGTNISIGSGTIGSMNGVAIGRQANGSADGVAVGIAANGTVYSVAVGSTALAYSHAVAVGNLANGWDRGTAVGSQANGHYFGTAAGLGANGSYVGSALGYFASANSNGVAVGSLANGDNAGVAIGSQANASGGTNRTAIGKMTVNSVDNSTALRGSLYLDGGSESIYYRTNFNTGGWAVKAFTINHPLDPENKVLRHYCMEGPEVWNVYAGNATLVDGLVTVELPDYYSALNQAGSEIYSLTPVGAYADLYVKEKVQNDRFVIGGSRNIEVSWSIKVLRADPACEADLQLRPIEQFKRDLYPGQIGEENTRINSDSSH